MRDYRLICIASNSALMEATLVVGMVMQRYRLDLAPGQMVKAQPKVTLRPRPGVWMTLHSTTSTATN